MHSVRPTQISSYIHKIINAPIIWVIAFSVLPKRFRQCLSLSDHQQPKNTTAMAVDKAWAVSCSISVHNYGMCTEKMIPTTTSSSPIISHLKRGPFALRLLFRILFHQMASVSIAFRYCNFKEHLRDYVFIKHSHGRHGLSRMATEMNKILTHAGSPPSLRSEIIDAILGMSLR